MPFDSPPDLIDRLARPPAGPTAVAPLEPHAPVGPIVLEGVLAVGEAGISYRGWDTRAGAAVIVLERFAGPDACRAPGFRAQTRAAGARVRVTDAPLLAAADAGCRRLFAHGTVFYAFAAETLCGRTHPDQLLARLKLEAQLRRPGLAVLLARLGACLALATLAGGPLTLGLAEALGPASAPGPGMALLFLAHLSLVAWLALGRLRRSAAQRARRTGRLEGPLLVTAVLGGPAAVLLLLCGWLAARLALGLGGGAAESEAGRLSGGPLP